MSVDTRPAPPRTTSAVPDPGPVARLVAGSLSLGIVAALVLTLVVFAGGTEPVITGSVLLSFALGWALMGALTARHTRRPLRWAYVPAAFMGTAGLALLTLTPGDTALTRIGWVWPPLTLALAVWLYVQVRRSVTGAARWLLTPVVVVLALVSVGAGYANVALAHDRGAYAAPGKMYDVHGHRIHLDCRGSGGPTVVLLNGMGEISASWARVAAPVARTTRVCAYDRAGQGWSTEAAHPQDGAAAAEDLHTLLDEAGEAGPFVLVGHSTGGTYAMTYASRYPDQVVGMAFLDSSSPEQFKRIAAYPGQYAVMRRGFALLPMLNRLGVARLAAASRLPAPAGAQVDALTSTPRAARNVRDELSVVRDVFTQAQALSSLGDRPVAVLTATENVTNEGWGEAHDQLAALSTNNVHRNVRSTHAGLLDDHGSAAASANAITAVVDAARHHTRLALK